MLMLNLFLSTLGTIFLFGSIVAPSQEFDLMADESVNYESHDQQEPKNSNEAEHIRKYLEKVNVNDDSYDLFDSIIAKNSLSESDIKQSFKEIKNEKNTEDVSLYRHPEVFNPIDFKPQRSRGRKTTLTPNTRIFKYITEHKKKKEPSKEEKITNWKKLKAIMEADKKKAAKDELVVLPPVIKVLKLQPSKESDQSSAGNDTDEVPDKYNRGKVILGSDDDTELSKSDRIRNLTCIACTNANSEKCNDPAQQNIETQTCRDNEVCYSRHSPFGIVTRGCIDTNKDLIYYVCSCNRCNYNPLNKMPIFFESPIRWKDNVIMTSRAKALRTSIMRDMECLDCIVPGSKELWEMNAFELACLEGDIESVPTKVCNDDEICGIMAKKESSYVWRGCIKNPNYNSWWYFCNESRCNVDVVISTHEIDFSIDLAA